MGHPLLATRPPVWRRILAALPVLLLLAAAGLPAAARAAEWGLINPGETTMPAVRARYGAPTKSTPQKLEGYDVQQWLYEGAQAPRGMQRMTVDFGLIVKGAFQREVVRSLLLEPRPGVFDRAMVLTGWGQPTGVGRQGDIPAFLYEEGLFVYFEKDGETVKSMLFTPRQPIPPPAETPRR
jgi:hypothetical protein